MKGHFSDESLHLFVNETLLPEYKLFISCCLNFIARFGTFELSDILCKTGITLKKRKRNIRNTSTHKASASYEFPNGLIIPRINGADEYGSSKKLHGSGFYF